MHHMVSEVQQRSTGMANNAASSYVAPAKGGLFNYQYGRRNVTIIVKAPLVASVAFLEIRSQLPH
jgi:hypothetical protein